MTINRGEIINICAEQNINNVKIIEKEDVIIVSGITSIYNKFMLIALLSKDYKAEISSSGIDGSFTLRLSEKKERDIINSDDSATFYAIDSFKEIYNICTSLNKFPDGYKYILSNIACVNLYQNNRKIDTKVVYTKDLKLQIVSFLYGLKYQPKLNPEIIITSPDGDNKYVIKVIETTKTLLNTLEYIIKETNLLYVISIKYIDRDKIYYKYKDNYKPSKRINKWLNKLGCFLIE